MQERPHTSPAGVERLIAARFGLPDATEHRSGQPALDDLRAIGRHEISSPLALMRFQCARSLER